MPVGRLVLNRNPDNFFAETEQVAFCTAHVVPGIDFTNDPLLMGRIHVRPGASVLVRSFVLRAGCGAECSHEQDENRMNQQRTRERSPGAQDQHSLAAIALEPARPIQDNRHESNALTAKAPEGDL
jgi:hypothetical protein